MTPEILKKLRGTPTRTLEFEHILIRDIERCPYMPYEYGYETWTANDNARLENLSQARHRLYLDAECYIDDKDRVIQRMAVFIRWLLKE